MNPGGLYGQARPENFPNVNDYRNSVVAEMMKNLNYVNIFNHGIGEVQELLKENESPKEEFNVSYLTAFSVLVREPDDNMSPTVHQLVASLSLQAKSLITTLKLEKLSVKELQVFTNCSPKSKQLFIKQYISPCIEMGVVTKTHLDNPHHPQQKYYLTDLGLAVLKQLEKENE